MVHNKSSILSIVLSTLIVSLVTLLIFWFVPEISAGSCSVPSASYSTIQSAVDDPICDTVNISSGTYKERIQISRPVILNGVGPSTPVINGNAGGSVIKMSTTKVELKNLTITNGKSFTGAGIRNSGTNLTLENIRIENNHADNDGGGLYHNHGNLKISNSIIVRNNSGSRGGGIFYNLETAEITDSTILNNHASFGGGIYNGNGTAILRKVVVRGNTCSIDGGGIFNTGKTVIYDSAIRGNKADWSGGAARAENGTVIINNSTIANNHSQVDGSLHSWNGKLQIYSSTITKNLGAPVVDNSQGTLKLKNTLVADNQAQNCQGTIQSEGYNLISSINGCNFQSTTGDILNNNPNLGALAGDPAYRPLLFGLGVNGGNPNGCEDHNNNILDTDQRGMPRVGRCDIGAFEYQGGFYEAFIPWLGENHCPTFFDDFSNPQSGWQTGEDRYVIAAYNNGEYQIRSKSDDYLYLFPSPACDRQNYTLEVDARWDSSPGMAYGLVFDIQNSFERYYLFSVNTEYQVFWLDYRDQNGWVSLTDLLETEHINKGKAVNHLKVVREGTNISLVINGHTMLVIDDNKILEPGGSGVFMAPYTDQSHADARFDNFLSQKLGSSVGQANGEGSSQYDIQQHFSIESADFSSSRIADLQKIK